MASFTKRTWKIGVKRVKKRTKRGLDWALDRKQKGQNRVTLGSGSGFAPSIMTTRRPSGLKGAVSFCCFGMLLVVSLVGAWKERSAHSISRRNRVRTTVLFNLYTRSSYSCPEQYLRLKPHSALSCRSPFPSPPIFMSCLHT